MHQELAELIRCVDRDILRPIAQLNFGRQPQYDIRPRSLVETYAEMFGRAPASRDQTWSRSVANSATNTNLPHLRDQVIGPG